MQTNEIHPMQALLDECTNYKALKPGEIIEGQIVKYEGKFNLDFSRVWSKSPIKYSRHQLKYLGKIQDGDRIPFKIEGENRDGQLEIKNLRISDLIYGHIYTARYLSSSDGGVICQIGPHKGFIETSRLGWSRSIWGKESIDAYVETYLGRLFDVKLMKYGELPQESGSRIRLSRKAAAVDPWVSLDAFTEGDNYYRGTIIGQKKDCFIVGLAEGVTGFLHYSEEANKDDYRPGDRLHVLIRHIDKDGRYIRLRR